MRVTGTEGLDPAAVTAVDGNGNDVPATLVNADLTSDTSLVIFRFTNDVYQLRYTGDGDTTGTANVEITHIGDLDDNWQVNEADLTAFFDSFGSRPGDAEYDATADTDANGFVGFRDAFHLFRNWGTTASDVPANLAAELRGHPYDLDGNRAVELADALIIVNAINGNFPDELDVDVNGDGNESLG